VSGREWKPGDVAVITSDSRHAGKRAMFCDDGGDRQAWAVECTDGLTMHYGARELRPLVVIDPEDREDVERVRDALWRGGHLDDWQAALRSLANPTPSRIGEPGTWGVVEASCVHSDERREWMRHRDDNWYVVGTDTKNNPDDWDSLIDPVLVREGVDRP
jgi:hypothetical protein